MRCAELVVGLIQAIRAVDRAAIESLVAPALVWDTSFAEGGEARLGFADLPAFAERLRSYGDEREVREVAELAGAVVARTEGRIRPPDGTHSGTEFFVYTCEGGRVVSRRPFAYRKEVLDALGVPQAERRGLLVVRDDDDERLYHFMIEPGSELTWASYSDLGQDDHDHCEMCWARFSTYPGDQAEGYATLDGCSWLCRDCFDEVRDHFGLRVCQPPGSGRTSRAGAP